MIQPSTSKEPGVVPPAPDQQGPQDRLCRTAGAAAPEGLKPAAPNLLEQVWTGDRGEASRKPRPARPREPHAVGSVGATFQWPVRVYWEDTDAGGIVFYANYLKFFERSRTEWLRSLGIGQQSLKDSTDCLFVVTEATVRYHRPARLDDELIVTSRMHETGRASMTIKQQALLKTEQNGVRLASLLCEATVRIGWIHGASLQPRRIPLSILDRLKNG